jgi:tetratricopeptide (TPR) repeat protein
MIDEARSRVEECRIRTGGDPVLRLADLGGSLFQLGALLTEQPELHDELDGVLAEAAEVYRQLAGMGDRSGLPGLALALDQRARVVGLLGRRADARALAEEGVAHFRDLADREPALYFASLATALANLGNQLAELGLHHEALEQIRESVAVCRRLAARNPAEGETELASALVELGIKLGEMGRREEAVEVLRDAIGRYRGLAAAATAAGPGGGGAWPGGGGAGWRGGAGSRYGDGPGQRIGGSAGGSTDDLADRWVALFALARELTQLDRADETRPYLDEAAALYRQLARKSPEFQSFLVAMAGRHGFTVTEDGRVEQSAPAGGARPAAVDPALVARIQRLNEQALRHSRNGSHGLAVSTARDAVELCRDATRSTPGMTVALARCLHNLSLVQSWNGQQSEALAAADEAVHLARRALAAAPDLVRPLLAEALDSLAGCLAALGRPDDALVAANECVALYRQLALADPAGKLPSLARVLNNLSIRLTACDRHEESLAAVREVVALYRRMRTEATDRAAGTVRADGAADPDPHLSGFLHALTNLALRLTRVGRNDEALAPVLEAVDLLPGLTDFHAGNDIPGLLESLTWLGHHLARQGHRREGRTVTRAAKDLRRRVG